VTYMIDQNGNFLTCEECDCMVHVHKNRRRSHIS